MAFIVPAICTQIPNVTGGVRLHTNDSKVSSATHSSHGELSTASTKGDLHSTPIHLAKGYLESIHLDQKNNVDPSQTQRSQRKLRSDLTVSFSLKSKPTQVASQRNSHFESGTGDLSTSSLSSKCILWTEAKDAQERKPSKDLPEDAIRPTTSRTRFLRKRERLEDQIKESLTQSCTCSGQYVPRGQLKKLITPQAVEIELKRMTNFPRRLINTIAKSTNSHIPTKVGCIGHVETRLPLSGDGDLCVKQETYGIIFSILLMVKQGAKIWSFVEEGVCDAYLPFELTKTASGLRSKHASQRNLKCFERWDVSDMVDFTRRQWAFLVPAFDTSPGDYVRHQQLRDEHILPFTQWEGLDHGGFGEVYRATIHPSHHVFGDEQSQDKPHVVAVKQLKKQDKEVFTREADILRSLSLTQHNHLHLITLLATYEQHGRFYIMFPLAESNLEQYWTNNPGPHREDVTRAKWLFEQSVGIANALSTVHRYFTNPKGSYLWHASHTIKNAQGVRNTVAGEPLPALFGRHGDIKPSNILVFMNQASTGGYGNLKITDFGITRFSTDDRRSVIEGGRITNSAAYRSPECDLPKGNVSTACDVWALGCIYLMLITWFSRGKHSINLFLSELQEKADWYETECFFSTYHNALDGRKKARVKSCVTKLIDELRTDLRCTEEFAEFLAIIEKQMIIIQEDNITPSLTAPGLHYARRSSSRNIARDVGTLLYALESSHGHPASL